MGMMGGGRGPGGPRGAYWDGGITDYHMHLDYASMADRDGAPALVLYPHFQQSIVPGWLDKFFKRRHRATAALANVVVLSPDPAWIATLPSRRSSHFSVSTAASSVCSVLLAGVHYGYALVLWDERGYDRWI